MLGMIETHKTKIALAIIALALVPVALVIRAKSIRKPTPFPLSTTVNAKMKYYSSRIRSNPADTIAYIELGKLEEGSGYFNAAVTHFTMAGAIGGDDASYLLPLGRAYTHLSRWEEAKAVLEKAVKSNPNDIETSANYAGLFYNNGQADLASKILQDFVANNPAYSRIDSGAPVEKIRRLMLCFSEAGDLKSTLQVAERLIKIDTGDVGALSIAGKTLLSLHKNREALVYLERAYKLDPNVSALCYQYGTALNLIGKEDEALKLWQKCISINPTAIDAYLSLATTYEKRKNWKLQSIALSQVASRTKSDLNMTLRAGKAAERAGQKTESAYWYSQSAYALKQYDRALRLAKIVASDPDPARHNAGLRTIAETYLAQHKFNEYLETVKKYASENTAKGCLQLAEAYGKADKLDDQIKYLKKTLGKEPKSAKAVHHDLSLIASKRGLRDEAEVEMTAAVAADPQSSELHSELGSLYYERRTLGDRLTKAIAEFEIAVKLNPKEAIGFQHLGVAFSAKNDFHRAALNLEHSVDLQPGHGPTYQELGRVYAKQGDKENSAKMFALYKKYVNYDLELKSLQARADANLKNSEAQIAYASLLAKSGDYPSALERYLIALSVDPNDDKTRTKVQRIYNILGQTDDPVSAASGGKKSSTSKL